MLQKYLSVRRIFFVRCPDSIDIVTMRNADRLSEYDREDMKLVREDYGTKVLYYIDCTAKDKQNTSITSAVEAVRTGTFDGIALGSEGSAVDVSVLKPLVDALGQTPCLLVLKVPLHCCRKRSAAFQLFRT